MIARKGKQQTTARIVVYLNRTRKLWSLANLKEPDDRGEVFGYDSTLALRDCVFVTRPLGAARIRRAPADKPMKEVFAWVVGTPCAIPDGALLREVTCNPHRSDYFHYRDGRRVNSAAVVVFGTDNRCYEVVS
jgi:hypothetical protein